MWSVGEASGEHMGLRIGRSAARSLRLTLATTVVAAFSVFALLVIPQLLTHIVGASSNYTAVPLSTSELAANWSPDRTTPSGGYESLSYGGRNDVLETRVDTTHASADPGFYRTEGIQRQIPASDTVKADLYVDSSWSTKDVRSGLWAVGKNGADITAYPIVEFVSGLGGGYTGWRVWNGTSWVNNSATYNTNAWNTLEISLNKDTHRFSVLINGTQISSNAGGSTANIGAVILNSFNNANNNATFNYAAHWSNFAYGSVEPAATVAACATTNTIHTTNLATWNTSDTRVTGHNQITASGLRVWTESNTSTDKAAGYYPANFALKDLGDQTIAQALDYENTTAGAAPGLQLVVDFDNNGTPDGILVGETVYGNNWWLSGSAVQFAKDGGPTVGGGGSASNGTPNQWLAAFPDAKVKVVGYSLGSGAKGDGIIKRISLGCTDYTFGVVPLVAPTELTPNDNSYTNNPSFDNTWKAVPGAVKYEYETTYGSSSYYTDTSDAGNYVLGGSTITRHNNGSPEATYTWRVRAIDALGTVGPWSDYSHVTVDSVKPTRPTLLTTPNNGFELTNDFYFTWTASTDAHPVKYEFQSAGSNSVDANGSLISAWNSIANGNPEQNNLTSPTIHSTGAPDGSYYWQVRAIDAAGNKSNWTSPWKMTIDSVAPTATLGFAGVGPSVKSFSVQFSEAVNQTDVENPANYFLNNWKPEWSFADLTGHAVVGYNAASRTATVTFTDSSWYVSGEQQWGVKNIRDLAGNTITSTTAYSTPPAGPSAPGVPTTTTPTNNTTVTWSWTASTDPGSYVSGVEKYRYKLTRGSDVVVGETETTSLSATTVVPGDGDYVLHVWAVDVAGNVGNESTGSVTVDTTPPEVAVGPTYNATDNEIQPDITATGDPVSFAWTTSVSPSDVTISDPSILIPTFTVHTDGTYSFTLTAKDALGNARTATFTFTYETPVPETINTETIPVVAEVASFADVTATTNTTTTDGTAAPSTTALRNAQIGATSDNVLGAQTKKSGDVLGAETAAVITPTTQGWKILGVLWYWWALIIAAVIGIWWLVAGRLRKQAQDV